jgi:hypothetical protein
MVYDPAPPASVVPARLLLVACSARKIASTTPIPAWNLYDGPCFRVLRKCSRDGYWPTDVDLLILSSRHGIVSPHQSIALYDEAMTAERAMSIRHAVHTRLIRTLHARPYRELLIVAGTSYLRALRLGPPWLPPHLSVQVAEGGIGRKLQQLRRWLVPPAGGA